MSKTNVAQPWVTSNALTENTEGVALSGGRVDSSIPNVTFVNFNAMSSTNLAEFVLEDRGIVDKEVARRWLTITHLESVRQLIRRG